MVYAFSKWMLEFSSFGEKRQSTWRNKDNIFGYMIDYDYLIVMRNSKKYFWSQLAYSIETPRNFRRIVVENRRRRKFVGKYTDRKYLLLPNYINILKC